MLGREVSQVRLSGPRRLLTPPPLLVSLAQDGISHADAVQVLADYILETGWKDYRVVELMGSPFEDDELSFRWFLEWPVGPWASDWAKAVLAVALFGEWQTKPWPCLERGPIGARP